MSAKIEVPILIVLIIITAYYYIKERKKSFEAARKYDLEQQKRKEAETMTKIFVKVKINGMMCQNCAAHVKKALSAFGNVTVDLDGKFAEIECSEMPDTAEIEKAVTECGYEFVGIE